MIPLPPALAGTATLGGCLLAIAGLAGINTILALRCCTASTSTSTSTSTSPSTGTRRRTGRGMEQGLGGERLDVVGLRMTIVGRQIGRGGVRAAAGRCRCCLVLGTATAATSLAEARSANGRDGGGGWLGGGGGGGGAIVGGRCTTTIGGSSSSSTISSSSSRSIGSTRSVGTSRS